ncbi:unnamed protein product, partial [Iphiclides podalirius]
MRFPGTEGIRVWRPNDNQDTGLPFPGTKESIHSRVRDCEDAGVTGAVDELLRRPDVPTPRSQSARTGTIGSVHRRTMASCRRNQLSGNNHQLNQRGNNHRPYWTPLVIRFVDGLDRPTIVSIKFDDFDSTCRRPPL